MKEGNGPIDEAQWPSPGDSHRPAHWVPFALNQLQHKEDDYRAANPSWVCSTSMTRLHSQICVRRDALSKGLTMAGYLAKEVAASPQGDVGTSHQKAL